MTAFRSCSPFPAQPGHQRPAADCAASIAAEAHNADGKHTAYLQPGHRSSARLRPLDPDLYQRLASVVASGRRNTVALADAGVLSTDTCFLGDPLDFADLPVAAVRASRGTNRLFLVGAVSPAHAHYLTERLTTLQHCPWARELTVYWPG